MVQAGREPGIPSAVCPVKRRSAAGIFRSGCTAWTSGLLVETVEDIEPVAPPPGGAAELGSIRMAAPVDRVAGTMRREEACKHGKISIGSEGSRGWFSRGTCCRRHERIRNESLEPDTRGYFLGWSAHGEKVLALPRGISHNEVSHFPRERLRHGREFGLADQPDLARPAPPESYGPTSLDRVRQAL